MKIKFVELNGCRIKMVSEDGLTWINTEVTPTGSKNASS